MKRPVFAAALVCLLLFFQFAFAQTDYTEPQAAEGLVYDGTTQYLLIPGDNHGNEDLHFYYQNPYTEEWSDDPANIPGGRYPGEYTVSWVLINGSEDPNTIEELRGVQNVSVAIDELDQPQPREGLVYIAKDWQVLIDPENPGTAYEGDAYYYRVVPETQWKTALPSAISARTYTIEYLLWSASETPGNDWNPTGSVQATITYQAADPQTPEEPGTPERPEQPEQPERPERPSIDPRVGENLTIPFFRIGDGEDIFDDSMSLPATGFPTRVNLSLAIQPENLRYEDLSMRIQIPVINVDAELTGVPAMGSTWAVEWLSDQAGLLSGSALPGEGYSMIAAHNHLDAEDMGPFGLLFSLEENDRVFVNTAEGDLQIYSVYANELLEPDDTIKMASIAMTEENSIILVTCENEMVEGGYLNRRVVFAKPLFR